MGGGFIQILVDGDGNVRDLTSVFSSLATGHIGYVDALAHLLLAGSRIVNLLQSHKDSTQQRFLLAEVLRVRSHI